jgi:hypothetical protein
MTRREGLIVADAGTTARTTKPEFQRTRMTPSAPPNHGQISQPQE